jgi:hypothetical protein
MPGSSEDRVEGLLALILVSLNKDRSLREKAYLLNLAGFSNVEIADLLETTPAGVGQALYEHRRDGRSKSKRRASKSK